ncbi:hypothetical protein HN512_02410 [Candidatus Peregrinibacteria bacterium]|jgi:hypothetical protein|nr:hypothetical protein [Candidatus Peregrinibacteria bacterium]MBT3598666.1 hypothetical protein [Candidatus Peregrinibacteria bacterium]MBT4585331.1 hypothetical protein [Candidatus Peregrinibacteria bacterium]MBT6730844.1 hypothetical protein [Candidatus Peregrinibacteria bacterium]MBT7008937.1 hypothetical protein [Candidatus Peregrinibacteria bacterium]
MSSFDEEKFNLAKEAAYNYFQNNKKINCPAIGEIRLNSDGFNHLIYKDKRHKQKRDWKNSIKRFHLTGYIKRILNGMAFYQEYSEWHEPIQITHHGKNETVNKLVAYFGFIAVIDDKIRIKIIIRKIGNGNPHLWSIIPIWKSKYYKDIKIVDISTGDLEID